MTTPLETLTAALADHYRIERELGAGGMATVYLAQDLKHDRKVAIKVLRPELAAVIGAERFVVEIKTTAALQHPHILPLFDSGTASVRSRGSQVTGPQGSADLDDAETRDSRPATFLYYVMPYIEGETLRTKLDREHQLGIEEAVKITMDVADALDYAHRHGVIHRDIKPENILLHDGRPMVADFGIALALSAAAGGRMTETGMSLGTPHYMSPEQATAEKEITGRSDIYSLGSVLYEMLAGNPPHTGATAQQIIMKIIAEPVAPVTAYRKSVPPNVAAAVARAVEKLPADRFGSAAEFAHALRDVTFHGPATGPTGTTRLPAPRLAAAGRDWRLWIAATALVVVGALAGRWSAVTGHAAALIARFTIETGAGRSVTRIPVNALALAPDGQTIVFVGQDAATSQTQLYTRRLDEMESHAVAGTEGATFPLFSPNGRRLAFVGTGGIFVLDVPLTGGSSSTVLTGQSQALSTELWLDDNTLLTTNGTGGIDAITLASKVSPIAVPDRAKGEQNLYLQATLPDRRTVLLIPSRGLGIIGPIVALDTRNGKRTPILEGPVNAAWYADGSLLWGERNGSLRAAPFDPGRLRITGSAVTIAEGVQQEIGGSPQATVSASGSLVFVPEEPLSLVLLDRAGKPQVLAEGRHYHSPRFSPDGRRLALDFTQQGERSVWTFDLGQKTLTRLSFDNDGHDPVWTRDGRWIAYEHEGGIWRRHGDGSGNADSVYTGPGVESALDFPPDGSILAAGAGTNGRFDVVRVLPESSKVEPFLVSGFTQEGATVSRDGRWLAYLSDETGRMEVYVRPYPAGGAKTLVSQGGGSEVRWGPDDRSLYYVGTANGHLSMIAAAVATTPAFAVTRRTPLFEASDFEPAEPHANWDISPDGTRFAMAHQAALHTLSVVIGWTEEIRRHESGARP